MKEGRGRKWEERRGEEGNREDKARGRGTETSDAGCNESWKGVSDERVQNSSAQTSRTDLGCHP